MEVVGPSESMCSALSFCGRAACADASTHVPPQGLLLREATGASRTLSFSTSPGLHDGGSVNKAKVSTPAP